MRASVAQTKLAARVPTGFEVQVSEEFAVRLDEAVAYRVDKYGLRSARKLIDSVDAIRELLAGSPFWVHSWTSTRKPPTLVPCGGCASTRILPSIAQVATHRPLCF